MIPFLSVPIQMSPPFSVMHLATSPGGTIPPWGILHLCVPVSKKVTFSPSTHRRPFLSPLMALTSFPGMPSIFLHSGWTVHNSPFSRYANE